MICRYVGEGNDMVLVQNQGSIEHSPQNLIEVVTAMRTFLFKLGNSFGILIQNVLAKGDGKLFVEQIRSLKNQRTPTFYRVKDFQKDLL